MGLLSCGRCLWCNEYSWDVLGCRCFANAVNRTGTCSAFDLFWLVNTPFSAVSVSCVGNGTGTCSAILFLFWLIHRFGMYSVVIVSVVINRFGIGSDIVLCVVNRTGTYTAVVVLFGL